MRHGRLCQWSNAYELYHQPANRFVADFIGKGVLLPVTVESDQSISTPLGDVAGKLPDNLKAGCKAELLVRPDDIQHDDSSENQARVKHRIFHGSTFLYTLTLEDGFDVLCLVPSHHDHPIGSRIGIRLEIDHLVVFPLS